MNRGGASLMARGRGRQSWRQVPVDSSVRDGAYSDGHMPASSNTKPYSSWQTLGSGSGGSGSKSNGNVTPTSRQGQGGAKQWRASSHPGNVSDFSRNKQFVTPSVKFNSGEKDVGNPDNEVASESSSLNLDQSRMKNVEPLPDLSSLNDSKSTEEVRDNERSESSISKDQFDICPPKSSSGVMLKPSLLTKNREKRNDTKRSIGGPKGIVLRSGMVLLKNYLSSSEQVNILKTCRTHGLGPAGFYQPRFANGGQLHLKLMSFGECWDPESNKYGELRQKYGDFRPLDSAKPPDVPQEFLELVDRAIQDAHSLIIDEDPKVKNVKDILPPVKPDICIVNYYATNGRLGLHQDKDEGRESLGKGIPIVSFSIGDSAEFLYGDQRDAKKADKIILESGDVLIFGGKSRHIFHGVPAILPDTGPKHLLEQTNFRPGRLNLTFRQHL